MYKADLKIGMLVVIGGAPPEGGLKTPYLRRAEDKIYEHHWIDKISGESKVDKLSPYVAYIEGLGTGVSFPAGQIAMVVDWKGREPEVKFWERDMPNNAFAVQLLVKQELLYLDFHLQHTDIIGPETYLACLKPA